MAKEQPESPLHERLLAAVGDRSYRRIAAETDHNAETVRRYMQGQAPSADFLARVCERYDVNAHWLMTGSGTMRQSDTAVHVLSEATPSELLAAVADTLERLLERVDRLEIFVQTLETRLRVDARGSAADDVIGKAVGGREGDATARGVHVDRRVAPSAGGGQDVGSRGTSTHSDGTRRNERYDSASGGSNHGSGRDRGGRDGAASRARLIADALAKRSSEDAD